MAFSVKCLNCDHLFVAKGEADYQSVGDGGPAECTGIELKDPQCPQCDSDNIIILEEIDEEFE